MEMIADLHVHSRHAAACSEMLTLENIEAAAVQKGIDIIGTGDFTHPAWMSEIKSKLEEHSGGVYKLRGGKGIRFVLTSEVCTIFESGGKVRKVHNCMIAPGIEDAVAVSELLSKRGDLKSDGRPIISASSTELVDIAKSVSDKFVVYPAHVWTPWFGALGASSGFDSISEAYEDRSGSIFAFETGLSSDPAMNWRVSMLDKYSQISGSDAHSLPNIGREATVFSFEDGKPVDYNAIYRGIRGENLKMTFEFYPEEGKYHYDGHRKCNVSLKPDEAMKYNNICPRCRRKLTVGVLHRVEELADRDEGAIPENAKGYVHIIPLMEIIASVKGVGKSSALVRRLYMEFIGKFSSEMHVLNDADISELESVDKETACAIGNVREGRISIKAGYDGVFGEIDVSGKKAGLDMKGGIQKRMNDF